MSKPDQLSGLGLRSHFMEPIFAGLNLNTFCKYETEGGVQWTKCDLLKYYTMVDFILVKIVAGFDRLAGLDWLLVIGIIGFRRRSMRLSVKDGRES